MTAPVSGIAPLPRRQERRSTVEAVGEFAPQRSDRALEIVERADHLDGASERCEGIGTSPSSHRRARRLGCDARDCPTPFGEDDWLPSSLHFLGEPTEIATGIDDGDRLRHLYT